MHITSPPDYRNTVTKLDPTRLPAILQAFVEAPPRRDYAHWEKLRHVKPPAGLSPEEWWMALKLNRMAAATMIPLSDLDGRPFSYGTPSSVQRLLHFVDQHTAGEIAMAEAVTTDEQARHHYLVNSVMEEAIRSSQLEGATTSRQVAKELLRTGRRPRDRSELMIANNYRALEFMREDMGSALTPELVTTLQRILTEGTLDHPAAAGRLQTPDEERVVVLDAATGKTIHTPPPAAELPWRLQAMCKFANGSEHDAAHFVHPVIRAILLHFWLAYDHPFVDGNGRTARALFYWYMRNHGYWLVEYLSISRILRQAPAKYSQAFLLTETDGGDTTYFLLHQLEVIRRAVEELRVYLQRKVQEVRDVERLVRDDGGLNHRQLALLSDALRDPERTYTYRSHAASHAVTEETARADLSELATRGLLDRGKSGRQHTFSPIVNLRSAIKAPS